MTLRELLEKTDVRDQSTEACYPASGGDDTYELIIQIDGHGKPLDAEVEKMWTRSHGMFITLCGVKGETR